MNLEHGVLFWAIGQGDSRCMEFRMNFEGREEEVTEKDLNYALEMADFMRIPTISLN